MNEVLPEPKELGIPVPGWRPWQPDVIEWVDSVFAEKNIAVLNAPPGVGKSIIALGFGRLDPRSTAILLTGTKQLQDQYASTAPGIVDMRGRGNFRCTLLGGYHTADEGVCTIGEPCEYKIADPLSGRIECPYYRRKAEAGRAWEVVTSYQFYLRDLLGGHTLSPVRAPRDLLVLDEAHELEDHIRHWREVNVTTRARTLLGIHETSPGDPDWLAGVLALGKEWLGAHDDVRRFWGDADRDARRDYTSIVRLAETLGPVEFALRKESAAWVYEYDKFSGQLTYKPVLVSGEAASPLWTSAKKFLLMSATITRIDLAELGLDPETYSYRELPSPFPTSHRPIIYSPSARVNQSMSQEDLAEWVDSLDEILESHPGDKGLVHTANYKLAQHYLVRSRFSRRLMSHTGLTRSSSLDDFKRSPEPVVLVSPSMTTGVDLPYDYCRFQVIAKIQWPNKGDRQIETRLGLPGGDAWYANKAVSHLVQAYGRGVRAADDSAVLYIIDSSYDMVRNRWGKLLPRYFTEAVVRRRK